MGKYYTVQEGLLYWFPYNVLWSTNWWKQYKNLTHHCLGFLQSGTEYTRGVFVEGTRRQSNKKMAGQSKIKCDKTLLVLCGKKKKHR